MPEPDPKIQIRCAKETDLPQISTIHTHYVLNTVITFTEEPLTLDQLAATYHAIAAEGLPYIVATDDNEQIIGFANAHGFRGMKGAYRHTVEITLFCRRGYTGMGIGSRLLRELLGLLRGQALPNNLKEENVEGDGERRKVRQILAVMAVDEEGEMAGLALKAFYEGFGFVLRGHLKQVGFKFGRW